MSTQASRAHPLSGQRVWAGAVIASAVAGCVGLLAPMSPSYAMKAAVVPLLLGLLAPMAPQHPWPVLGPANRLTFGRSVVVGLLAACLGEPHASGLACAAVGCLAFGLDWLDGRVARQTGFASPFGARLDMELDALTILALSALVWQVGGVGPWVLASGAMRYAFVGASWVWPWLDRPLPPDPRRAWVCGVQVTLLIGALLPWPVEGLATGLSMVGLAALTGSFAVDVRWLADPARSRDPGEAAAGASTR